MTEDTLFISGPLYNAIKAVLDNKEDRARELQKQEPSSQQATPERKLAEAQATLATLERKP